MSEANPWIDEIWPNIQALEYSQEEWRSALLKLPDNNAAALAWIKDWQFGLGSKSSLICRTLLIIWYRQLTGDINALPTFEEVKSAALNRGN